MCFILPPKAKVPNIGIVDASHTGGGADTSSGSNVGIEPQTPRLAVDLDLYSKRYAGSVLTLAHPVGPFVRQCLAFLGRKPWKVARRTLGKIEIASAL